MLMRVIADAKPYILLDSDPFWSVLSPDPLCRVPVDFSFDRATWIYMNQASICFCMLCFLMSVGWKFRNRNCSVNVATSVCLSLWKLGACGVAFTAEQLYECAKFFGDVIGFQAQKLCNSGKHQVPLYLNCYYVTVVIIMLRKLLLFQVELYWFRNTFIHSLNLHNLAFHVLTL